MPREGIRPPQASTFFGPDAGPRITIHGRTVRIHLAGILDRGGVARLIREADRHLVGQGLLVVLDASRLQHLDYRAVPQLLRWQRGLRGYRHRLCLAGWNAYLRAILAMEDWDGELGHGSAHWGWSPDWEPSRHVQVP
jgi:ABC-type transporter Mla MlaB component